MGPNLTVKSVHVFKYRSMQVFDKFYINSSRYRVLERLYYNVVRSSKHFHYVVVIIPLPPSHTHQFPDSFPDLLFNKDEYMKINIIIFQ